jgi:ASC-1-like (ASCH) protein
MANNHLVILERRYLEAILSGRKRIESRFSRTRRSGFGRVSAGDRLFLKELSGAVRAVATAGAVKNFDCLTPEKIAELKERYNEGIVGSERYWRSKADCRFGFLVWLEDVKAIEPLRVVKRDWRGWVVLTEQEDFGLMKAVGLEKA